jgi:hypothetical protein
MTGVRVKRIAWYVRNQIMHPYLSAAKARNMLA